MVTATLHDASTGNYILPVQPGSTNVSFLDYSNIPTGYFPMPMSQTVYVPPVGDVTDVDFDLQPLDAAICGTVIDSSVHGDAEYDGLWIYADGGDFGDFQGRTDSDGNFIIPVKGTTEEEYSITIETYGYDVYPWEHSAIDVGVGDTVTGYNFVLGEAWISNSISGTVTDTDGEPVESSLVILQNNEMPFKKAWQSVETDSIGEYLFENIPPWEGHWFVGTYKDSLGYTDPRLVIIEDLSDDTLIVDADFEFSLSKIEEGRPHNASQFSLGDVYPNPFNSTAAVKIEVYEEIVDTKVKLIDILGRCRRENYSGRLIKGIHEIRIDARGLPSGIYFLRVGNKETVQTRELLLLK